MTTRSVYDKPSGWKSHLLAFNTFSKRHPLIYRSSLILFWLSIIYYFIPSNNNSQALLTLDDIRINTGNGNNNEYSGALKNIASYFESVNPLASTAEETTKRIENLYASLNFETDNNVWEDDYTLDDFLTIAVGPHKGEKVETPQDLKVYDNNPRLTLSVYFHYLNSVQKSIENAATGETDITANTPLVPFSWYDWGDMHNFNKLIALEKTKVECPFLYEAAFENETLYAIEREVGETLFDLNRDHYYQPHWYNWARSQWSGVNDNHIKKFCGKDMHRGEDEATIDSQKSRFDLPFKVKQCLHQVRVEVYEIQCRSFLLNEVQPPISLTVLKEDQSAHRFFINKKKKLNIVESNLVDRYIDSQIEDRGTRDPKEVVFDHISEWKKLQNTPLFTDTKVDIPDGYKTDPSEASITIPRDDFEFDARAKIDELQQRSSLNAHEQHYLNSLLFSIKQPGSQLSKYFKEPESIYNYHRKGGHHDERFFKNLAYFNSAERDQRLNNLIRTWLKFTNSLGLATWLAHGTVVGYKNNGITLPWDSDFDVQMPIKHLHLLAEYFNQTMVVQDPSEGNGRYLIDISNNILPRDVANGMTKIDARFIDTDTGCYVDITGLSVSQNILKDYHRRYWEDNLKSINWDTVDRHIKGKGEGYAGLSVKEMMELVLKGQEKSGLPKDVYNSFQSYLDRLGVVKKDKINQYLKKPESVKKDDPMLNFSDARNHFEAKYTDDERYILHREMGLYNCRDQHFYSYDELVPLLKTGYHGIEALIPHQAMKLIQREYNNRLHYKYDSFEKCKFLPEFRVWIPEEYLEKCSNRRNWFPIFHDSVKHITEDMDIEDVEILTRNIGAYEDIDVLSYIFRSGQMTAYRNKEIAIEHDKNMTDAEKLEAINAMRLNLLPYVRNPAKDPYMYKYQQSKWAQIENEFNGTYLHQIKYNVRQKYAKKVWNLTKSLHDRTCDIYKIPVRDESGTTSILDLNPFGATIFSCKDVKGQKINDKDPKYYEFFSDDQKKKEEATKSSDSAKPTST